MSQSTDNNRNYRCYKQKFQTKYRKTRRETQSPANSSLSSLTHDNANKSTSSSSGTTGQKSTLNHNAKPYIPITARSRNYRNKLNENMKRLNANEQKCKFCSYNSL